MLQTPRFAILLLLCASLTEKITAQTPGTLDNTFAGTGTKTIDFSPIFQTSDIGTATLVLPDGKILVGAISNDGDGLFMRLNSDGTIDHTFGESGSTLIRSFNKVSKMAVQSDGKIIAVGWGDSGGLLVFRFTANGLVDSTFGGGDGRYDYLPSTPIGSGSTAEATDVVVLGDNKILVVGFSRVSSFTPPQTQTITDNQLLIRLNANGTLDNTFNSTGIRTFFQYSGSSSTGQFPQIPSQANSISLQSDGKIVVGGTKGVFVVNNSHQNITIARFLATGAFDNTFSGDGLAEFNLLTFTVQGNTFSSTESARDIEVLPDGKILVLSNVQDSTFLSGIGLVRVLSNGNLDNAFGVGGSLKIFPNTVNRVVSPLTMARASQGKLYLAGFEIFQGLTYAYTIIRADSLGRLDSSFNASGSIRIESLLPNNIERLGLALQSDGKPILVGNSQAKSVAAFRLTTSGALDNSFNGNGIQIFNNPNPKSDDNAQSVAQSDEGRIAVAGYGGDSNDLTIALLNDNGTPVSTFGNNGNVIIPITSGATNAGAMTFQPDGKLLVNANGFRRFKTDGTPDSSFSGDGVSNLNNVAEKIRVLTNGKILIAGYSGSHCRLTMQNENGSNDNSFGTNGGVTTTVGTSSIFYDAIVLSDGKILAIGRTTVSNQNNFLIARFNSNGALDSSFSGDGIATISNLNAQASCAFVQSDGKYVIGGASGTNTEALVARFNQNGSLDTTFGMNRDSTFFRKGVARVASAELSGLNLPKFIVVEGDGKIMMTARVSSGAVAMRMRENGASVSNNAIDSTFVGDGVARYTMPTGISLRAITTQQNGRILLISDVNGTNNTRDFWIARVFNSVRFGSNVTSGQTGQIVLGGSGATVNITGNTGAGGAITASVGINPTIVGALPSGVNQLLKDRVWTITTTASGLTYNLTLDFSGVSGIRNFNSIRILKRNDSLSQWQDVRQAPINATVTYNAPFITVSGLTSFSDFAGAQDSLSQLSVQDLPAKPKSFSLSQNYPNPFNPTTVIAYQLPSVSDVRLELFDVLGRKVSTLVNSRQEPGSHSLTLNASSLNLASGVYFYRIQAGQFVATKKMLLVK